MVGCFNPMSGLFHSLEAISRVLITPKGQPQNNSFCKRQIGHCTDTPDI